MAKRLTIAEKAKILEKLSEPGSTQCSVAKKLGVSRRTVQNALNNATVIKQHMKSGTSLKRCHLKVDEKFGDINRATFEWFTRMREKHGEIPVIESVICHKATQFANQLQIEGFKASSGWFRSWRSRWGLSSFKVS